MNKNNSVALALILATVLAILCGCKKENINPYSRLPNGTILYRSEIDLPGVTNPFKVIGSYFKTDAGYFKYYLLSNNGVYINSASDGLKATSQPYTWTKGRMFVPIIVVDWNNWHKNYYKYVRTDTNGVSLGDTLNAAQLPK